MRAKLARLATGPPHLLERIFLIVAKELDRQVPSGPHWHRDLLMQIKGQYRGTPSSLQHWRELADYLAFRHFYRHSYSFFLDWNELVKLVTSLREVWERVNKALFMAQLADDT